MTASEAMNTIDSLPEHIDSLVALLKKEIQWQSQTWSGLGRLGAQRGDNAAELLVALLPYLHKIQDYCGEAIGRIEDLQRDPWQGQTEEPVKRV